MAEIVFRGFTERAGLADYVTSSSSGTGDWHVGERADARTLEALHRRGYDGEHHRARQFALEDFDRNDLIVALDRSHERILSSWARTTDDTDKPARRPLQLGSAARRHDRRHGTIDAAV